MLKRLLAPLTPFVPLSPPLLGGGEGDKKGILRWAASPPTAKSPYFPSPLPPLPSPAAESERERGGAGGGVRVQPHTASKVRILP